MIVLAVVGCSQAPQEGDVYIELESPVAEAPSPSGGAEIGSGGSTGGAVVESTGGAESSTGGVVSSGGIQAGGAPPESAGGTDLGPEPECRADSDCYDRCLDGVCVSCISDDDCTSPNEPYCLPDNSCAVCSRGEHCPDELPSCSADGYCGHCNPGDSRECVVPPSFGTQYCHQNGGQWELDCFSAESGESMGNPGQSGCGDNTTNPGERCADGSCSWPAGSC